MSREERVGAREHPTVHPDKPSVSLEPGPSEATSELVADAVADDGAPRGDHDRLGQVQDSRGAQDAGEDDDRLTRHEEAEERR